MRTQLEIVFPHLLYVGGNAVTPSDNEWEIQKLIASTLDIDRNDSAYSIYLHVMLSVLPKIVPDLFSRQDNRTNKLLTIARQPFDPKM